MFQLFPSPLGRQVIGAEGNEPAIVKNMETAPAQALKVEVSRILERHGGQREAVPPGKPEKTIQGFQVRCAAAPLPVASIPGS